MGDQVSLSSFHRDIGIPINFQEESSLVRFWILELHEPLEVSRDVNPPVQITWGTRVSSRISTQDSDIPSSFQMKDEPAFKPLQGNLTLFLVRESRYPLHLRQKTQGPSHTYCWGKTPLEVLVESWLKSSIKDRESALILGRYGVHGAFLELLCWY